ncbi:MAG: hypothetical protein HYT77_09230 [Deltaproteobacteria bacterium]|nr:hypothetical protein [Deltaproteobacteria bacterium]
MSFETCTHGTNALAALALDPIEDRGDWGELLKTSPEYLDIYKECDRLYPDTTERDVAGLLNRRLVVYSKKSPFLSSLSREEREEQVVDLIDKTRGPQHVNLGGNVLVFGGITLIMGLCIALTYFGIRKPIVNHFYARKGLTPPFLLAIPFSWAGLITPGLLGGIGGGAFGAVKSNTALHETHERRLEEARQLLAS